MEPSVEDYVKIMQLYARYARAIDSGDGEGWSRCYAPDGRYWSSTFGECVGREALKVFAFEHFRRWSELGIQTRHWNNQVLLEDRGDGVIAGSVYLLLSGVKKGEAPRLYLQTVYADTLIRHDGQWVLKDRQSHADMKPDPSELGFTRWDGSAH